MEKYIIECISHTVLYARTALRIGIILGILCLCLTVITKMIIVMWKNTREEPLVKANNNKISININLNIFSKNVIKKRNKRKS